jgi:hypothetical protein
VRSVEDDGAISLQIRAGAAFYFGKDRITIVRILSVRLKLSAHFIRSDDDCANPIGVGLCPVTFAGTRQADEDVEGRHDSNR